IKKSYLYADIKKKITIIVSLHAEKDNGDGLQGGRKMAGTYRVSAGFSRVRSGSSLISLKTEYGMG
ncbi:MAG TPA: hypothetical protein DCL38_05570, partial [Lachnospiraceae bacterium]|nr:hypothetical protein [Lachnospiraceae bacterium]